MKIGRTLFWFKDGNEQLNNLTDDFFGLGVLLNRLLNEKYDGKKIKFINIDFFTENTFKLYPILSREAPYYCNGHLRYYGVFDLNLFESFSYEEQYNFVWEKAHKYLIEAAKSNKNPKLLEAANYAYKKGFELELNPDFRVVDLFIPIDVKEVRASIWILFQKDGMASKFTLQSSENLIFEQVLDKTEKGVEIFLEMYKSIAIENGNIVIKVRKDVASLPVKIPLSKIII
ncbi:hypothetical protein GEO21_18835 [Sphingobacterium faecium]|uniref:hypothetical protein n=1 Tax=Sphingobacterium faecium TaxID=34087 RepID=UPI0012918240|nr:hypothetical protein [Sphingobacterium faecium]MQP29550.1 hypothetical protein [Sphingobacterium faecium]